MTWDVHLSDFLNGRAAPQRRGLRDHRAVPPAKVAHRPGGPGDPRAREVADVQQELLNAPPLSSGSSAALFERRQQSRHGAGAVLLRNPAEGPEGPVQSRDHAREVFVPALRRSRGPLEVGKPVFSSDSIPASRVNPQRLAIARHAVEICRDLEGAARCRRARGRCRPGGTERTPSPPGRRGRGGKGELRTPPNATAAADSGGIRRSPGGPPAEAARGSAGPEPRHRHPRGRA